MKQLPIFKPTIAESIEVDFRKRLKKRKQKSGVDQSGDLWSQDKDQERDMALFFLDIRNFTPFVEKHGAVKVIYVIRKLFASFQKIIKANHGQIIETSGDGFYAAFGYHESVEKAVNAAIRSGYSIIDELEKLNKSCFESKLNRKLEVGIGLHAGRVATGSINLGGENHKIVMGYPVNIASRLEAATKELNNNFIVSSRVYELWDGHTNEEAMVEINLKGVSEPYKIHLLGRPYGEN